MRRQTCKIVAIKKRKRLNKMIMKIKKRKRRNAKKMPKKMTKMVMRMVMKTWKSRNTRLIGLR